MSYRGFKRLLGESSLERKSRFLLGAVTLLLISGSFWLYAKMNVGLAYEATTIAGRMLTNQILYHYHVKKWDPRAAEAIADFPEQFERKTGDGSESKFVDALAKYQFRLLKLHTKERANQYDPEDRDYFEKLRDNPEDVETNRSSGGKFYYYAAIRMTAKCLACHPLDKEKEEMGAVMKENMFYGTVRIEMDSRAIEEGVNLGRAILISNALVTSLLVMAGSYLIVRYVVVKPVKHLKEVSDAIANGYFNVRSEIQTGDEFEDLSFAFNRMIRNLLTKQEELNENKQVLDRKVDELAQANLALFESDKLKGEFLATMSHELRTPLHSILGFSDLLHQGDNLTEKQQRWATNIRGSGANLLALINDILELAKVEAGKMEVKPAEFTVADLVERAVAAMRPLAEKKQLDLRSEVVDDLPQVRQDQGKLQQILSNLLSNAVKFTPEGGKVLVEATIDGDDLVLTVSDTGVGIAAAERDAVFDKFRQGANPLTREHEGTGLGLSIVRELAKLLGGDVTLESEPGLGSTFTVRVPRWLSAELAADMSSEKAAT
jgi:two-component system, NarL family, sensor histidine kinase BarA